MGLPTAFQSATMGDLSGLSGEMAWSGWSHFKEMSNILEKESAPRLDDNSKEPSGLVTQVVLISGTDSLYRINKRPDKLHTRERWLGCMLGATIGFPIRSWSSDLTMLFHFGREPTRTSGADSMEGCILIVFLEWQVSE
jgi:hypothetical protein